jgi:ADP-ribose pyrophosphatase
LGLGGPVGVALLPVRDGRVYLRRAFRHATRQWELECPRGFRSAGDSVEGTARHEAEEELGIAVEGVEELGAVYANTGLLAGGARAFLVHLADTPSERTHESHEALGEVVALTPTELMGAIARGEVRDGFTLSAVALAIARGHLAPDAPGAG